LHGNPLAYEWSENFLLDLQIKELERLIWIPKPFIEREGWRKLVKNQERQQYILKAHNLFYSYKDSN